MMSYTAGIPFFRGTAESDLFFSLAMFGTPVFLHMLSDGFASPATTRPPHSLREDRSCWSGTTNIYL